MTAASPRAWAALALASSALAAACGDDFAPVSEVRGLRVLAIEAEPPEIGFAGTTTLTPTVHPATPGQVDYTWSVCVASLGPDLAFACADASLECALSGDATATLAGADVLSCILDSGTDVAAQVQQRIEEAEAAAGGGDPVEVTVYVRLVTRLKGNTVEAVKAVVLSEGQVRNANPTIAGVALGDTVWQPTDVPRVAARDEVMLKATPGDDARQTVTASDGTESTEALLWQWFASEGEIGSAFTDDTNPEVAWTAPSLLAEEIARCTAVWIVLRDGRGGADVVERRLQVVAADADAAQLPAAETCLDADAIGATDPIVATDAAP